VFVVLAFVRWRGVAQSDRLAINGKGNSLLLPAIAGTICLVLALSGVTLLFYPHSNDVSYSEFYVLDSNRQTVDYPTNVTQGASSALILGITNHENNANTYSGTVSLNNSTLYSFDNLTLFHSTHQGKSKSYNLHSLTHSTKPTNCTCGLTSMRVLRTAAFCGAHRNTSIASTPATFVFHVFMSNVVRLCLKFFLVI
jgi:hypothetical protein